MKANFMFAGEWEGTYVEFNRKSELDFVPPEGMRFMFEPGGFEVFVDLTIWYHDEGVLVVSFQDMLYESKEEFLMAIRPFLNGNEWEYRANKEGNEIIKGILEEKSL